MLAFSSNFSDYHAMKQIELAVFEDESSIRQLIELNLLDTQYRIGAEAVTRRQALDIVKAVHAGELMIHAFLLDGNLDNPERRLFSDAHAIYNYMQELDLVQPVLGISTDRLAEKGIPIEPELDITKWCISSKLVPSLDSLFSSEEMAS